MNGFSRNLPSNNSELRHRLYAGELFIIPATTESKSLIDAVSNELAAAFSECHDPRHAQFMFSSIEYFDIVGLLRKQFYTEPRFHTLVRCLTESFQFDSTLNGFDAARLRSVLHAGHTNPAASALYYGHRDTWYANPQSMITWWIPLHDVTAAESFEFFPDEFARPVLNDSEIFDFDDWIAIDQKKLIGWQDRTTGLTAQYPQLLQTPDSRSISVECNCGDVLLFSGQHLHQTRKQMTNKTRFSIDFRTVHLPDYAANVGAANVDNRSTGSWLKKFAPLSTAAPMDLDINVLGQTN